MADWGYDTHNGPDTWPNKYPHAGGQNQSPIDILTSLVQPRDFESPLSWRYPPGVCKSIVNTGCGWRVDAHGDGSELTGGPLSHSYEVVQFHCHWGETPCCGSEHTIDGKSYAGELHFVHWNKELFSTCADAVPSPTGLTVIAVFLEEGEENTEIQKLCDVLHEIPTKDERVELSSDIDITAMYPADSAYWTYLGSLTTPPCYESVTWIVFKNPITVSQEQFNCFRQMKKPCDHEEVEENTGLIDRNFRPPQLLNDREIFECI